MTYGNAQAPKPPRKNKGLVIALVFLVSAVLLLCCAGVVSSVAGRNGRAVGTSLTIPEASADPTFAGEPAASTATPKVAPARPRTLAASDVSLKVRTKGKTCFGSAGCNVEFSIDATVSPDVSISEPCEVTYSVKGLEDAFEATLTIVDNERYRQDSWQFGSTTSSGKKLTAKVTEVRCE